MYTIDADSDEGKAVFGALLASKYDPRLHRMYEAFGLRLSQDCMSMDAID